MPKPVPKPLPTPRNFAAANYHGPAANTAAVVTYAAAGAGIYHVIDQIICGYSGAPTGGRLTIEDGSGTTVWSIDIPAAGPQTFTFPEGIRGSANTALIITLAAAGAGVSGKVNVLGKRTQAKT